MQDLGASGHRREPRSDASPVPWKCQASGTRLSPFRPSGSTILGYPAPFALRALGLVREDEGLVERGAQGFDDLGLAWHAQRTRERKIIG